VRAAVAEIPAPESTGRAMHAMVVNPPEHALPYEATNLLHDIGWKITTAEDYRSALEVARTGPIDVILMPQPDPDEPAGASTGELAKLMRLIDVRRIATIMLAEGDQTRSDSQALIDVVDRDVSPAELRGRLTMIERYHERFRRMEQEVRNMERLGKRLNQHFREVDQEMRLAARLQRDFLPRIKNPIRNTRFATVYRPASWVSGDMFDVFRIDEEHTGFYVADAVGHGMAASLLTMFIKRSIVPKRVDGDSYTILSPAEVMAILNDALADQSLPNCQFVTACYGLLNHRTLTLEYARGGHPYPVLITADGIVSELESSGALLGLFKGEDFPVNEVQLHPGDKVLVYTDGVELAFQAAEGATLDTTAYLSAFKAVASLPIQDMLREMEAQLDDEAGSLNPRDDITLLGLEVLEA
jgi:sigma-B regulation protein RsbU (phosphoserine phosphatase)